MDHTIPPINIPALLKAYDLRPSKGLGQNFLADNNILRKIVEAGGISPEDTVLEIGAGLGSLTRFLALTANHVVAVEIDRRLFPVLQDTLKPFDNIKIVAGDILQLNPSELITNSTYKVVANIPYYITSAIIRHLLQADKKPSTLVLTTQREVAMRICAAPPNLSLLALSVQVFGKPQIGQKIPAGAFYPAPKVDSTVIKITLYPEPIIPNALLDQFFKLIKAGFSQKRKTLRNTLAAGMAWSKVESESALLAAGIDPQRRAQTLSLDEWNTLTHHCFGIELEE